MNEETLTIVRIIFATKTNATLLGDNWVLSTSRQQRNSSLTPKLSTKRGH